MAREVELTDNLRTQQRDDIRADRDVKAREHLFGDSGAAEDVPPLENNDASACARKIRRVNEPVMAPADDDDVILRRFWHRPHSIISCRAEARSARRAKDLPHADWIRVSRANLAAVREPELPRLGRLLR